MKKMLLVAGAIVAGAVAMPGAAEASPIYCDAWNAVQDRLDRDIAYCIDDPSPIDDLLTLEP